MIAIKSKRPHFIAVVLPRDGQNRERDLLILLNARCHGVVVSVGCRMLDDALEICRWISDERVQRFEGNVLFVSLEIFAMPKLLVAEQVLLAGAAAGEGEPLHVVGFAHVIARRIIERWMRRGDRDNGGEMR